MQRRFAPPWPYRVGSGVNCSAMIGCGLWFPPTLRGVEEKRHSGFEVCLIDFLCGMTAPSVVLRKFALLEVITELSNGLDTGIRWSAIGGEF